MKNYLSIKKVQDISPFEIKSKTQIFIYLRSQSIPGIQIKGRWHIEREYINKAIAWRESTSTLDELVHRITIQTIDAQAKRRIREAAYPFFERDNPLALLFVGEFFISHENEDSVISIIQREIDLRTNKDKMLNLREAASELGISPYRLRNRIISGSIPGERIKNDWRIQKSEIEKIKDNAGKYLSVFETSCRIAKAENTIFDPENRYSRVFLNQYLKSSSLGESLLRGEDINVIDTAHNTYFYPAELSLEFEELIRKYFRRYGSRRKLKEKLSSDSFWDSYPKTNTILQKYATNVNDKAITYLQDILIHTLRCEITECSDEDIKRMKEYVDSIGIAFASQSWAKLIRYTKENYECNYSIEFYRSTTRKQKTSESVQPYTREQFFRMSYMVFNNEYIHDNQLITKSIVDPKNAYVWLYSAIHYLGAWRKSDIDSSLPILDLPYTPEETILNIRNASFDKDAIMLSIKLEGELNNRIIPPHKTREKQSERGLTLHIPTSLRVVFGTIYAIYCYHVHSGHSINKNLSEFMFVRFFGPDYEKIFGIKPFSNRRANKSYMDEIAQNVTSDIGAVPNFLGYTVAQYSRGHVRGSNSTPRYLSAKLDGLDKNEIMMLLFESGFCSFITNNLLQLVYGDQYRSLDVQSQNNLIKLSNLNAYKSETLTSLLDSAYTRSEKALNTILQNIKKENDKKYVAEQMLVNIATRSSLSGSSGISCLCAARRLPCANPNRTCFGCIFGIYEASFFYLALDQVKQAYKRLNRSKTIAERTKNQMLIDQEILPAITEIISVAETSYGMDLSEYKENLISLITSKGVTENDRID
ncbi:MAG: helix-turn-helix domain-containing protein [Clostridiales bacterium]|nr:helix-turn-helix domain-containing protein [Clostridiales bacterium]